jgi:hypothetical protein
MESYGLRFRNHDSDCGFPVDVVDGIGRHWSACEFATCVRQFDTLDGLDGLDGPSPFLERERVIEILYACGRRISRHRWPECRKVCRGGMGRDDKELGSRFYKRLSQVDGLVNGDAASCDDT